MQNEVWTNTNQTYKESLDYQLGGISSSPEFQTGFDYSISAMSADLLGLAFDNVSVGENIISPEKAKKLYGVQIPEDWHRSRVKAKAHYEYLEKEFNKNISRGRGTIGSILRALAGGFSDPIGIVGAIALSRTGSALTPLLTMGSMMQRIVKFGTIAGITNTGLGKTFFQYIGQDYGLKEASLDFSVGFIFGGIAGIKKPKTRLKPQFEKRDSASIDTIITETNKVRDKPEIESILKDDTAIDDYLTQPSKNLRLNKSLSDENIKNLISKKQGLERTLSILKHIYPDEFKMIQNPELFEMNKALIQVGITDEEALEGWTLFRQTLLKNETIPEQPKKQIPDAITENAIPEKPEVVDAEALQETVPSETRAKTPTDFRDEPEFKSLTSEIKEIRERADLDNIEKATEIKRVAKKLKHFHNERNKINKILTNLDADIDNPESVRVSKQIKNIRSSNIPANIKSRIINRILDAQKKDFSGEQAQISPAKKLLIESYDQAAEDSIKAFALGELTKLYHAEESDSVKEKLKGVIETLDDDLNNLLFGDR